MINTFPHGFSRVLSLKFNCTKYRSNVLLDTVDRWVALEILPMIPMKDSAERSITIFGLILTFNVSWAKCHM